MTDQDYVAPHAVALKALARRVEADDVVSPEVKAAFLDDLVGTDPSSLRALLTAISPEETLTPRAGG
jgi:hypothetical protein